MTEKVNVLILLSKRTRHGERIESPAAPDPQVTAHEHAPY